MYQIQNKTETSCEILLYSLIAHGYTAMNIIEQLKEAKNLTHITLRINSDGGDVFEALAIYNYLKGLDADITVMIDGLAASAATIVACAGRVIMPSNAQMMIHNPFGMVQGDSEELRAMADVLDKVKASIIAVYTAKTGKSSDEISALMDSESWLSADEALALGLCDEVIAEEHKADPETPSGSVEVLDAVKAERERLQELGALMTPERKGIIMKAKYETFQSAKDIALELLKIQSRRDDSRELDGITALTAKIADDNIRSVAEIINRKRGYDNGRQ